MTSTRNSKLSLGIQLSLGQDGVLCVREIRTINTLTSKDDDGVLITGSTFGSDQIVIVVLLKKMRPLYPLRFLLKVYSAIDDYFFITDHVKLFDVKFAHSQRSVSVIQRLVVWRHAIVDNICLPLCIKEQRRIYPIDLGNPDGIGPRTGRRW